jgi:hypothetical protein
MPNLAWVQPEYSDVQNKLERHWYLEKSLVLFGSHVERLLSETTIVLATHDPTIENVKFLEEYYDEYFAPLAEIIVGRSFRTGISKARKESRLLILADDDLYLEAMDIRANLLMCAEYDGATGFNEVIDLTRKQAQLLRRTGITRGIDVSKTKPAKDVKSQFRFMRREALKRNDKDVRLFQSPNHALRLPSS